MREEVVWPATARRLAHEGLAWQPQIGDWCTVLGAEHVGEGNAGLWLVISLAGERGLVRLADAAGMWPATQVPARDCLWLPTAGKLKTWLRMHGYRVATGELSAPLLATSGQSLRHVCRITRPSDEASIEREGLTEAEAVAAAVLHLLGAATGGP